MREHLASSGFASTDLDIHLKQRGIEKLSLAGMLADTCLETTGKFTGELGFHLTLVPDATAGASDQAVQVAHGINGATCANAVLRTEDLPAVLPQA